MLYEYGVNETEGTAMNINFRQIIFVLVGQLCAALMSKRVLTGYLIGVMAALKTAYLYGGYASNHPIQIFEPWLMNFRSLADITIMLAGFILVVADAPFVDSRSLLTIYRTSRGNWYDGLCLYVLVQGIIYFALSLAASCIYTIPHGYIQNQWSVAMKQFVLWPSDKAIITWHLVAPDKALIESTLPWKALFHTFLLMLLYSLVLGMLLYVLNAGVNKAIGTIAAAAVHVGGIILMNLNVSYKITRWSLLKNSSYLWHFETKLDLLFSYAFFLLCYIGILFIGPQILKHADFRYSVGEGND